MPLVDILISALAVPLGKFLLKSYLGEPAGAVGGGIIDIAKKKFDSLREQREAERQFGRIGEEIVTRLVPLFEAAARRGHLNAEAVAHELALTLEGRIEADFFLTRDLDPAKLTTALRQARPLGRGMSEAETSLYDRALEETVRYLVEVAAQLPKFESKAAAASLQRLSHISEDLGEVLDRTQRIERGVSLLVSKEEEKVQRYEADYRQAVIRSLDYVELFGADIPPEAKQHSLSVAYVSLNVQPESDADEEAIGSLPVEAVLDGLGKGTGRLLIRGQAGSGKSTLFRWAALEAAGLSILDHGVDESAYTRALFAARPNSLPLHERLAGTPESDFEGTVEMFRAVALDRRASRAPWRARVPLLVRLRDCKGGRLPRPEDFPLHVAGALGNPPAEWVQSVLREGRALILLDGVDEVPNAHRSQLEREITAIVETYPENFYLLSTRPAAVPDGWLSRLGFQEASVDPMSEADKQTFIRKWHQAVGHELERQRRPDPELTQLAEALIEHLPENPPISRLASNPLLCAMICAMHRERNRKLPESLPALCEAICEMLLHRRERESGLGMEEFPEHYRVLQYEQKRAIVQDIAHWMVLNQESAIERDQARHCVAAALTSLAGQDEKQADAVLTALIERSGILRETRPGAIDFIHNTIKEYLAAERFVDDGNIPLLAKSALNPEWQPIVLFAVATKRRGIANQMMERLLQTPPAMADYEAVPTDGQERTRYLLALRCRAIALHLDREVEARLDTITHSLFPPRTMADAEALSSAGDIAVDFLRYRKGMGARQAAASVRTLRLIGTEKAKRYLRDYLEDPRLTVASELAQAVNPLTIRAVRSALLRGEILVESIRKQIHDLEPLRGLEIKSLNLSGTQVSDLSPLASLSVLHTLDLSSTQVSDLSPLANLSTLQSLRLTGTQVSDLSPLASLSALQSLHLSGTQVSDLSPLASLSALQSLTLVGAQVSHLSPLAGLSALQSLTLASHEVSDLSPLAGLFALQSLHLLFTQVSDLSPLASLSALQSLRLTNTQVSDLSPLASLAALQSLHLTSPQVSNLSPLASLSALRSLHLSGTQVSDLSPLASLSGLRSLYLSGTQVSDLSPLANLAALESLTLVGTQVSDLSPLANLATLESLTLVGTQVSDLSPVADIPGLKILRR